MRDLASRRTSVETCVKLKVFHVFCIGGSKQWYAKTSKTLGRPRKEKRGQNFFAHMIWTKILLLESVSFYKRQTKKSLRTRARTLVLRRGTPQLMLDSKKSQKPDAQTDHHYSSRSVEKLTFGYKSFKQVGVSAAHMNFFLTYVETFRVSIRVQRQTRSKSKTKDNVCSTVCKF